MSNRLQYCNNKGIDVLTCIKEIHPLSLVSIILIYTYIDQIFSSNLFKEILPKA